MLLWTRPRSERPCVALPDRTALGAGCRGDEYADPLGSLHGELRVQAGVQSHIEWVIGTESNCTNGIRSHRERRLSKKSRRRAQGPGLSVPSFITGMVVGAFFCFLIWILASNQYEGPTEPAVALPEITTPLEDMEFQFYDLLPQSDPEQSSYSLDVGTTLLVPTGTDHSNAADRTSSSQSTSLVPDAVTGSAIDQDSNASASAHRLVKRAEPPTVTTVESEPMPKPVASGNRSPNASGFVIQVGSFRSRDSARQLQAQLIIEGYKAHIADVPLPAGDTIFRVLIGPFLVRADAEVAVDALSKGNQRKPLLLEMRKSTG